MHYADPKHHMYNVTIVLVLFATLIVPTWLIPLTYASNTSASFAQPSTINAQVNNNNVVVQMHLVLVENTTIMPTFHIIVDTSKNSTTVTKNVTQPITYAIQKLVSTAKIDKFVLTATSTNVSTTYTLTEDYVFTVVGVTNQTGTVVNANLAFLHMNMTSPMKINGIELNSVGTAYLVQSLNGLTRANYDFFIDGSTALTTQIPIATTVRFWLLDYTWTPIIAVWNTTRNLLGQNTMWQYQPPIARYNLTLGRKSPEGTTYLFKYAAIFQPSLTITVPASAQSNVNTVTFTLPTPEEIIMPIIIITAIAILVVTLVLDRRYSRTTIVRTSRRKR